ncbi:MAG: ComEC/Rec2 family competence protein [Capsulimonadales bacterium]|nr:ComEC/Rec2 family competence protein [Capsulimonadales bacterium]
MRPRPIAVLLCGLIIGILLAPAVPLAPPFAYGAAALASVALACLRPPFRPELLLLPLILLGIGRTREVSLPRPDDISRFVGSPSLQVEGRIDSLPEVRADSSSDGGTRFLVHALRVDDYRAVHAVRGRIAVTLRHGNAPTVGTPVRLRGRVEAFLERTNPDGFDTADYRNRHGVFCRMTVRHPDDLRSLGPPQVSPLRIAGDIRERIQAQTARFLSPEDSALLDGLLLSIRGSIPGALSDSFERTGTVHILSVSGLHLTAFAGALTIGFRYLLLPKFLGHSLAIGLIWLFVLAAGGGAAPLRSAVMATVLLCAPLLKRTAEPLHSLAFAALVLLFADPGSLYDAGFQLSFAAVGGLLLFVGPLSERYLPIVPFAPLPERFARGVLVALLVGLVAEIALAPLVAYHFSLFSPIAPVANLLIAVWSEVLLLATLAVLPVSLLLPAFLTKWLFLPLAGGVRLLRTMTVGFAALPFASFSVPAPPVAALWVYYVLLGVAACYVRRRPAPSATVPVSAPSALASPAVVDDRLPDDGRASAARHLP